jgi:uncharacterized protein (DUF2384 family)
MESELYSKAMAFFNDARMTEKWLNHPSSYFGEQTPLEHFSTEQGKKEVLNYLDACTHGKTKN